MSIEDPYFVVRDEISQSVKQCEQKLAEWRVLMEVKQQSSNLSFQISEGTLKIYSRNRLLDSLRLDSIFQKVLFDLKNYGFPSFDLLLDSFFVENGLLKYYVITGLDWIT